MDPNEKIVISGIAGRYPECDNIAEFKEALMKGIDIITTDARRYPVGVMNTPERFGKINNIEKFDASFFGIHPKQADFMDPRHRIILETVHECIIDAGFNPKEVRGTKTGVYSALCQFNNVDELRSQKTDGYTNIGLTLGMSANRASYCFDFKGPSYIVDTACSSSFYALVNAIQDMENGYIDSAIVCSGTLVMHPHETSEFNKLNMLATDGKCKVFSSLRDGYVRSEAVISIFLQKQSDCRRVYATVLGGRSNADGYKVQGITYPSSKMQLTLMKELYTAANVNPREVTFVESHGTGTPAGDEEELLSIVDMFCENRKGILPVGSVKSNMGHSEAVSGLCSISKMVIAMESGIIPANLHVEPLDTELPGVKDGKVKIVTENLPWNGGIVGLNSFGFGGANAHVVIKSNTKEKKITNKKRRNRLVHVSGRTGEAVNHFLDGIVKNQDDDEFLALVDEIHKIDIEGYYFRGYAIVGDNPKREIGRYNKEIPIWFVYNGMGSQWLGMGKDLMKVDAFRNTINRCASALKPYNVDLVDILTSDSPSIFDDITNTFCGITAIQIALTDVLSLLGIVPDHFVGHSLGEVACSYADGQLTPEEAILLAYARGYGSSNAKRYPGQMVAVGLSAEECEKMLPEDVWIACQNGKSSVTISGAVEAVNVFVEKLHSQGIFAKKVNSGGLAFHSKYILEAGELLYDFIKTVIKDPKPRSEKWISTSVSEQQKHESWTNYNCAEYHRNNFCSKVLFDRIYQYVPENAIVIEVGPHGLLQAILKKELGPNVTNISLVNRASDDNENFFLSSIGKIFLAGGQPNLRKLYNDVTLPVSRGTEMLSPWIKWDHSLNWYVPLWCNKESFGEVVTVNLSDENYSYLSGHNIDGRVLMPATGYLELVWQVLSHLCLKDITTLPVVMENIHFKRATILPPVEDVKFLINIMKHSGNFEIFEGGSVVASGKISVPTNIAAEFLNPEPPTVPRDNYLKLNVDDFYSECHLRQYMYKGYFQGITECDVHGLQGTVQWKEKFASFLDTMLHLTIIADTARTVQLPTFIEKIVIDPVNHLKQATQDGELPIFYHKNLNVLKSGAIEIIGLESSRAPQRVKIQEAPLLETYEFVPYEPLSLEKIKLERALQIALQIILQNSKGLIKRPQICEATQDDKDSLLPQIKELLNTQPLTQAEYIKYQPNAKKGSYDVVILTEAKINEINVETLLTFLRERGFVIYLGDILKIDRSSLQILYHAETSDNNIYLLKLCSQFPQNYSVVNVKNTNFDWLENIKKTAVNKGNKVVYLFSQGENTSGIAGLLKCLLAEPTELNFRAVFIQDHNADEFSVDNDFYFEQLTKDLTLNVLKNGRWGTFVHLPLKPIENRDVENATVNILTAGDLSTLKWVEGYTNPNRDPKSETVYVFYSSLNFRDVMIASGKLQGSQTKGPIVHEGIIGIECSGVTKRGKRVMGIVGQGLSLEVQTDPSFTWEVPKHWSLEDAATVPCVYATCYYAMIIRGQMRPGESILIHSGTGGIGLSAISIAVSMGCTVYTTVSSQEKRDYLKKLYPQLQDQNIGNSRNRSFRKMIMVNTNRRGVDLVLNSLSAELFQDSLKCIANRGRFLEIGKVDFINRTPIDSNMFLKNCSFHGILLDDLFETHLDVKQEINDLVYEGIRNGVVKPLPRTVFHETEVESAFRYLSTGKHKGKVLVKVRNEEPATLKSPVRSISAIPKVYFDPKKSYIFIGGLGGFGLELTNWLIQRGARNVILNSRRNISNGYQSYCVKKWTQFNEITVKINTDDTTNLEGATKLVAQAQKLGPVGGIFNMALVLKDALIENQTNEFYETVFKPKIISGQNMDTVSRKYCPALDHFVVFSSIACGRGNAGQTNYGMANSALERLCEERKKEHLPGLAVQWGPIGNVGALVKTETHDQVFEQIVSQNIFACISTLEKFMLQSETAVGASTVLGNKKSTKSTESAKSPLETVAHILGIRNTDLVDKNTTLSQMGLDSLMVAEVKQTLYRNFQLDLNADEIRELTFQKLILLDSDAPSPATNGIHEDLSEEMNAMVRYETIIELNGSEVTNKIIFLIHPIEGHTELLRHIATQLKAVVYGLQSTKDANCDNCQDYASYFIRQIRTKQPSGPYLLCGYSYGAIVAFEMGLQLEQAGETVHIVSLDGSVDYVKSILENSFLRHKGSVEKSRSAILHQFVQSFSNLNQDKVRDTLESISSWEEQTEVLSDLISKEMGLNSNDVSISADLYYKRCRSGFYYEPQSKLNGYFLLIRREENDALSEDYGMQRFCNQRIEIMTLKGDHRTMLLNDKIISEKLNDLLLKL